LLAEAGLTDRPDAPVVAPSPAGDAHVFHQYVIRARERDRLRAHLAAAGIGTMVYYPMPLHLQPALAALGLRAGAFPRAERAAEGGARAADLPGAHARARGDGRGRDRPLLPRLIGRARIVAPEDSR
jgi:hypothetical protein